jgi:hypothetical protein
MKIYINFSILLIFLFFFGFWAYHSSIHKYFRTKARLFYVGAGLALAMVNKLAATIDDQT